MSGSLIFERSVSGRRGYRLPPGDVPAKLPAAVLPEEQLRPAPPQLPEVAEFDAVRHYTRLSQLNFSVDTHFYPLGDWYPAMPQASLWCVTELASKEAIDRLADTLSRMR